MSGVLAFIFVIAGVVCILGVIIAAMALRSENKPDAELSYARMLLMQVMVQDDLMPQLPTSLRDDIRKFINQQHRSLTR